MLIHMVYDKVHTRVAGHIVKLTRQFIILLQNRVTGQN